MANSNNEYSHKRYDEYAPIENQLEFSINAAYRIDNLAWNEASDTINIASELKWENLKIAQIGIDGKWMFYTDWTIYAKIDFGSIDSGSNQDSDYNGNDRTLEYSRSNNQGGGDVYDASIGVGKKFHLLNPTGEEILSISPLIGLSLHQQNLTMTNGLQILPAAGPYSGLNSTYDTKWQGPWVGIKAELAISENWLFTISSEYHWSEYVAHANWNLRPEYQHPVSFTHISKGSGISLSASAHNQLTKNWYASIHVARQEWHTAPGIDQTYFSDGSVGRYILNQVSWNSTVISLALHHYF